MSAVIESPWPTLMTDPVDHTYTQDAYKSPLTFSGGKSDSMMVALLRAVYSGPHETQLVASVEQAVPIVANWLSMNRFQGRAERILPVFKRCKLRLCGKGACLPRSLLLNMQRCKFPVSSNEQLSFLLAVGS